MQAFDAIQLFPIEACNLEKVVNKGGFRRKHTKIGLTNGIKDLVQKKPLKTGESTSKQRSVKSLMPFVNFRQCKKKQNATTVKTSN